MTESVIRRVLPAAVGGGEAPELDDDALAALYAEEGSPWLRVNFVSSVDGSATRDGRSGGLSDDADRRVFAALRRRCDAVLVGAGTVRAEGYGGLSVDAEATAWRLSHGRAATPRLAVVTDRMALSPTDDVFTRAERTPIVITSTASRRRHGAVFAHVAEVVDCGEEAVDAARIPGLLAGLGLPRILCEGGPGLFGSLASAGVVDELCLTVSPLMVGGNGIRILRSARAIGAELRLAHVLAAGDTLLVRYLAGDAQAASAAESRIV